MKGARGHGRWLAAVAALIATLALPVAGAAAAPSRAEFVAQSEVLCQATNRAIDARSDSLYRRYQRLHPRGRRSELTKAQKRRDDVLFYGGLARVLIFEGQSLHALDRRLQLVPEPPSDASVIAQWIESRRVDADLVKDAGRQLRHVARHKPQRALGLLFSFDSIEDQFGLTDLIVGSFAFDQCYLADQSF